MDSAAAKSFEMQARVRHNAEQYQNSIQDLYNWEKEIKSKDKSLLQKALFAENSDGLKTLPVRSQVQEQPPRTKPKAKEEGTKKDEESSAGQIAEKSEEKQQKEKQPEPAPKISPPKEEEPVAAENPVGPDNPTAPEVPEAPEAPVVPLDPIEEKRNEANVYKNRGNACVKVSDFQTAILEYSKAIEIFPDEQVFFCNRALCYLRQELYEECIEDCNQALLLDSLSKKAYYRRMQANESLGNHLDALKDCTSVLSIDPKNVEAKKSLERINNRLKKNSNTTKGASFSADREDLIDIQPYDKPPHLRSSKPLQRVKVAEVVTSKNSTEMEPLKISDEDIEKLFNSNCGPFVEIKKDSTYQAKKAQEIIAESTKEAAATVSATALRAASVSAQTSAPVLEIIKPESKVEPEPESKPEPEALKKVTTPLIKEIEETSQKPEVMEISEESSLKILQQSAEEKEDEVPSTSAETLVQEKPAEKSSAVQEEKRIERPLPPAPVSSVQFYCAWRELSRDQKFAYLKSIELANLSRILGAGFDSDTLTEILIILHDYYVPSFDPNTAQTLLEVSKNHQVNILSSFMSDDDQYYLSRILNTFAANNTPLDLVRQITRNFKLH